ncbi:sema domain, transmembrane domain (TM), and cytoplasmic domain, (semaphorin) 6D, like isoform X7 [Brienomyrus brachyistius]|uniref:sema domain, transmembrane domain (TM), and cytoplasmic domain, (semaphorin) 6D, like isoform X7 n=1 Tax=Brienomyrus brachyistius TaxID=42636 RepID=UPI0020B3F9C5|nr:sema domain, transmembrane domain (TM), and cytoplasmic domain, (semaphorin) 6D, like isoform X7 [Brienomyrus brachyistius]
MRPSGLLLPCLVSLMTSCLWAISFPEDDIPIDSIDYHYSRQYPVFRGRPIGNESLHRLDFQLMTKIQDTLFIAGRDQVYLVSLRESYRNEIIPYRKLTWRSGQADRETCAMKGKHRDECHNFIKVLVPRNEDLVFICGTNGFNPMCRYYRLDNLEFDGEEISGLARCPFDAKQTNVALFADGKLYSATVADFLASDAVIYRSMGDGSALRTIKYDSKWLKEPHFLHAVDYGHYVYIFFREIATEHNSLGKAVFSRVARICKNDVGGSQRVLEKHWTSFVKARLNCSVPGESFFYFDVLQSITDIIDINGVPTVVGVFTTQLNSIPGSAVCAFSMADIEKVFRGRFKEQKTPDSVWTAFPEERLPKPRPGCCAGRGPAEAYKSSIDFPDETLLFIKSHPLMDSAVPSVRDEPWFTKTRVRYRMTALAVDNSAGLHHNYTVVFIGSEAGILLKVLAKSSTFSLNSSVLLEEIDVFNRAKCLSNSEDDRRILSLHLDKENHGIFVAFSSCVIRLPLSRCGRHGSCHKSCIASRDPYCAWTTHGSCEKVQPGGLSSGYEQDVEYGNTAQLGDCHGMWEIQSGESNQMVHMNVVITCVFAAFLLGAFIAGMVVYCYRDAFLRKPRRVHKDAESAQSCTDSAGSFAKLNGLFDSPVKEYQQSIDSPKLYTNLLSNGKDTATGDTKTIILSSQGQPPELAALPTPESTPVLQQKGLQPTKSQWDKAHCKISTPRKDTAAKSPQYFSSSPPPHSAVGQAHIPSAVVLPNATHSYQAPFAGADVPHSERKVQHAEHGASSRSSRKEHRRSVDARNTLNELLKHLNENEGTNMKAILADVPKSRQNAIDAMSMTEIPPKVPSREASLYSPSSSLPRNSPTKRVDVPTTPTSPPGQMNTLERQRVYHRNSSQRHSISAPPKNMNSNGVAVSRQSSINRGGYMPPTPPSRLDSHAATVAAHPQPSVSRQSSYSGQGSLPQMGVKRTPSLKPDVPPKPSGFVQQTTQTRVVHKYSY